MLFAHKVIVLSNIPLGMKILTFFGIYIYVRTGKFFKQKVLSEIKSQCVRSKYLSKMLLTSTTFIMFIFH